MASNFAHVYTCEGTATHQAEAQARLLQLPAPQVLPPSHPYNGCFALLHCARVATIKHQLRRKATPVTCAGVFWVWGLHSAC